MTYQLDQWGTEERDRLRLCRVEQQGRRAGELRSYGATGGLRAAEHLRLVLSEVQIADVRQQVSFSLMTDFENFSVLAHQGSQVAQLDTQLNQLVSWAEALQ
ncbi:hypothetical protein BH09ACT4_BH09ACT4_10200 [soil metagenome]